MSDEIKDKNGWKVKILTTCKILKTGQRKDDENQTEHIPIISR